MTEWTPAAAGTEIAWEIVGLLQRRLRQSEEAWRQAAQARDEAERVLNARLEAAEGESARLRERVKGESDLADALEAQCRACAAALRDLRARLAVEAERALAAEQALRSRERRLLLIFNNLLTRLKRA